MTIDDENFPRFSLNKKIHLAQRRRAAEKNKAKSSEATSP
jgi:hypothetical protein